LYTQRIEPLFRDERPGTCSQCHAAGVDLEIFVRDTPCETLACLVERGLVDPAHPEDSRLLELIGQAVPDSELITQQVIDEEREGFEQWLTYSLECNACRGAVCGSAEAGVRCESTLPPNADPALGDPGGCGSAQLEEVFFQTIYSNRGRCSPCHFNDHAGEEAPQWIEVDYACDEASRRTYQNVIERGLIDVQEPERSLLLLKPLSESAGGVEHGGGNKFSDEEDPGYVSFAYFVRRYAACQREAGAP
jgi:hypothetical protein